MNEEKEHEKPDARGGRSFSSTHAHRCLTRSFGFYRFTLLTGPSGCSLPVLPSCIPMSTKARHGRWRQSDLRLFDGLQVLQEILAQEIWRTSFSEIRLWASMLKRTHHLHRRGPPGAFKNMDKASPGFRPVHTPKQTAGRALGKSSPRFPWPSRAHPRADPWCIQRCDPRKPGESGQRRGWRCLKLF